MMESVVRKLHQTQFVEHDILASAEHSAVSFLKNVKGVIFLGKYINTR